MERDVDQVVATHRLAEGSPLGRVGEEVDGRLVATRDVDRISGRIEQRGDRRWFEFANVQIVDDVQKIVGNERSRESGTEYRHGDRQEYQQQQCEDGARSSRP